MAIIVYRRPTGHVLIPLIDGTVPVSSVLGGSELRAVFYVVGHGRTDGDVIYIKSEVENYNGFFYVNAIDVNQFSIQSLDKPYAASDPELDIKFIKTIETATIYRDFLTHPWNCIYTPINYILHTDLWPTNTVDTVRSVSSVTDSNGYCDITADGDIKATGSADKLQYIKITGAGVYDGVYQILTWASDTSFVIDLAYSSATDTAVTGQSIQYYYSNLVVRVRIYGGLASGHHFADQKPYELLTTIDLIPDEDNEVKFSVHEYLKDHIDINNNLLKGTLPNNIDAFTMFYVTYGEEYDDSDGTTLSRSTVSHTDDSSAFEGYAVNAILPFKNIYSGALSEYVMGSDLEGKFLTNFEEPTIFSGEYFDLSFIYPYDFVSGLYLRQVNYINGVAQSPTDISLESYSSGIYRATVEADCANNLIDISIVLKDVLASLTAFDVDNDSVGAYSWADTDYSGITDDAQFAADGEPVVQLTLTPSSSKVGYVPYNCLAGKAISVSYTYLVNWGGSGAADHDIDIILLNKDLETIASDNFFTASPAPAFPYTVTCSDTASFLSADVTEDVYYIGFSVTFNDSKGATQMKVTSLTATASMDEVLSEVKTLTVDCTCDNQSVHLSWLNNLGGFDHWNFKAEKEYMVEIGETGEKKKNIFPTWPSSYGEFADTIRQQTFRESRKQFLVRSQHLTLAQVEAISYIKSSVLVQEVNSIYDRRTVLIDNQSWTKRKDSDKADTYTIQFLMTYTDDISSQRI